MEVLIGISALAALVGFLVGWSVQRWQERRKTRAAFSAYLAPEMVQELEQHPDRLRLGLEEKPVEYVIFQIWDQPLRNIPVCYERLFPIIIESGAMLDEFAQSLVFVNFGAQPFDVPTAPDARSRLVDRLLAELGPDLRLVHGCASCLVGNYGAAWRFSYGALIPNCNAVLDELLKLEFGTAKELPPLLVHPPVTGGAKG